MPVTDVTTDVSHHIPNDEVTGECAVCPHTWTFHDRIAARYCTATIAGKFSRGCVCTPYPAEPNQADKDTR